MKCEKCGQNEATTHIRSVVGGFVKEYNLCTDCAKESGLINNSHNSLTGMLASMFGDFLVAEHHSLNEVRCSVCGSNFRDIAKSGKAGCTECYKTFKNELLPYLKRVHGSTKHVGKVPNNTPNMVVDNQDTVEALRMRLNRLVAEEKYEEAAIIRDKIKEKEKTADE